jgi:hypothetical protein
MINTLVILLIIIILILILSIFLILKNKEKYLADYMDYKLCRCQDFNKTLNDLHKK